MSDLRPTTPQDRRGLKAVTRRQLEMAGGVTSFEHVTRVKAPQLSKYGSPDDEAFMPLDVVFDLILDTRSNAILSYIAEKAGFQLVALTGEAQGSRLPDIGDAASLVEGYGEFISLLAAAVADGKVTPSEANSLAGKIEVLVQQLRSLGRVIDAAVKGGAA